MRITVGFLFAVMVATLASGCASLARPNWFSPGPAAYQQRLAEQYDPYPEKDAGPDMVGVRPPGFREPAPEPLRARPVERFSNSRWLPWNWLR